MRKSRDQRILESLNLMKEFEDSNLHADYRYRFIRDMNVRLEKGKSMTTKQRAWFDSLIQEGVPKIDIDKEKAALIKEALETPNMQHRNEVLRSFLGRISAGFSLSEKQEAFLSDIIKEAEEVRKYGPYSPDEETISILQDCVMISKSYSPVYWSTHPGTARALAEVQSWLGDRSLRITEKSTEKLQTALRSRLRELRHKPYASPGDLIWYIGHGRQKVPGVVVEPVSVSETGNLVYGVLVEGNVVFSSRARLSKRK